MPALPQAPRRPLRVSLFQPDTDQPYPIEITGLDGQVLQDCKVINASPRGMFLQVQRPTSPQDHLLFKFETPMGETVRGKLKVSWARDGGEAAADLPQGVGTEVLEFFDETEQLWLGALETEVRNYTVADIATGADQLRIEPKTPLPAAATELSRSRAPAVVITTDDGTPIGLVTRDRLLLEFANATGKTCSDIMEPLPTTVAHYLGLPAVRQIARNHSCDFLVVTTEGRFSGMVETTQIHQLLHEAEQLAERRDDMEKKRQWEMTIHDLRNPISVITSAIELLTTGIMSPNKFLEDKIPSIIKKNANQLLNLVDKIAEPNQPFGNEVRPTTPIALEPIVASCVSSQSLYANKKNITLTWRHSENPAFLRMDPLSLEQVLSNILDNAIKYTSTGGRITVRTSVIDNETIIEVEDNGQGIPFHQQEKIFDYRTTSNAKTTAGESSSGLGLYHVKKLVQAASGTITLASHPGLGCLVRIKIPYTAPTP